MGVAARHDAESRDNRHGTASQALRPVRAHPEAASNPARRTFAFARGAAGANDSHQIHAPDVRAVIRNDTSGATAAKRKQAKATRKTIAAAQAIPTLDLLSRPQAKIGHQRTTEHEMSNIRVLPSSTEIRQPHLVRLLPRNLRKTRLAM